MKQIIKDYERLLTNLFTDNDINKQALTCLEGFSIIFDNELTKETEDYVYCPFCGLKLSHEVETDINTKKVCKYLLCPFE